MIFVVLALVIFYSWLAWQTFGRFGFRQREFHAIKARVNADRVQAWAAEMLTQYPAGASTIVLSNPPSFLKDLRMGSYGPFISVSPEGPSSNRCVSLLYTYALGWGGPGHFIDAGDRSFTEPTNAKCIEWVSGVYYRSVFSP